MSWIKESLDLSLLVLVFVDAVAVGEKVMVQKGNFPTNVWPAIVRRVTCDGDLAFAGTRDPCDV
jgi:hypothetical protein